MKLIIDGVEYLFNTPPERKRLKDWLAENDIDSHEGDLTLTYNVDNTQPVLIWREGGFGFKKYVTEPPALPVLTEEEPKDDPILKTKVSQYIETLKSEDGGTILDAVAEDLEGLIS